MGDEVPFIGILQVLALIERNTGQERVSNHPRKKQSKT